jgi:Tfp pilus assembly protein PilO
MSTTNNKYSRYATAIKPVLHSPIVKTYGSLIASIFAMIIFILFAIKPTIETILVLQKELENQKQTLEKVRQKSADLAKGVENYQKIPSDIKDKIEIAVPKSPDLPNLIRSLEQTAAQPQASISALQFQPIITEQPSQSVKSTQLAEVLFTLNIQGPYESLTKILDNLRSNPRLVSITNLSFNKTEDKGLVMSVTGKAFYLK